MRIHALPQLPTSTSIITENLIGRRHLEDIIFPPLSIRLLRLLRDSIKGTTLADVQDLLKKLSHTNLPHTRPLSALKMRELLQRDLDLRAAVLKLVHLVPDISLEAVLIGVIAGCAVIGLMYLFSLLRDPEMVADDVHRMWLGRFGGGGGDTDVGELRLRRLLRREDLVSIAILARDTEHFKITAALMLEVLKMDEEMSNLERDLLFFSCDDTMFSKVALMQAFKSFGMRLGAKLMSKNWDNMLTELDRICIDFIQLIGEYFIPRCSTSESSVFYYKKKGEYYQYLAALMEGDKKKGYTAFAIDSYLRAAEKADNTLAPSNPLIIEIYLRACLLCYNNMDSPIRAFIIGKEALDLVISGVAALDWETKLEALALADILNQILIVLESEILNFLLAQCKPKGGLISG